MISEKVYIDTQLETKTTFGVRVDTGEGVFVNAKIAKKHDIQEGEVRELVLVPNPDNGENTCVWRAIGVSMNDTTPAVEPDTPRVEVAKLEDRIADYFRDEENQFAHTAGMLAEELAVSDTEMQLTLSRMHNAGEITKAQVWKQGGKDKASFVLWAGDTSWFSA
tara:strand:+ start:149 stop:640 length:492 start_codon:yes stop_codon:yes gene_type:complete